MTLITIRKGNSGQWLESNRILQSGEPGYDLSNRLLKIGDGVSSWSDLPYYGSGLFSSTEHFHTSDNITNFNYSVSGLIPSIISTGYLTSYFSNNQYILSVTGLQPSGNYVNNITASTGIYITESDGTYSIAVTGNFGLTGSQVDNRVSGYLQAGSGIIFNYSNNNLTINSIATGNTIIGSGSSNIDIGTLDDAVDNYLDTFLVAGTGINFSYNNNTLTIESNFVQPPLSSSGTGIVGQFSYDSDYFYICVDNNLWKRVGLNSW